MARNKYDVDEVLEDKFDLNQLKRLLAYLIPYRKRFVSVGFMMLSASAFTMLIPQFFPEQGHEGNRILQLFDTACRILQRLQPSLQDQIHQPDRTADHSRHAL